MLTGVGEREALAVAERLRREVAIEFRDFPVPISVSVGIADSGPVRRRRVARARRQPRAVRGQAAGPRPLRGPPRRDAGDARRAGRRPRRRAARGRHAAGRDARPARRRHRPPLRDRRPLRRADRRRARACRPTRSSACAWPACCTTSASSASPTRCCSSPAGSSRPSGRRSAATRRWAPGSSSTPTCATSPAGCSPTTSASTARGYPRGLAGDEHPARGPHPRRRRRLRGDDRRPPVPPRAGRGRGARRAACAAPARSSTPRVVAAFLRVLDALSRRRRACGGPSSPSSRTTNCRPTRLAACARRCSGSTGAAGVALEDLDAELEHVPRGG